MTSTGCNHLGSFRNSYCVYRWDPLQTQGIQVQGEKIYIAPVGFKSYAQYFYFQQTEEANVFKKVQNDKFGGEPTLYTPLERQVRDYMRYGDIKYDAYFITKIHNFELDTIPAIEKLYEKGGFKFYKRPAIAD